MGSKYIKIIIIIAIIGCKSNGNEIKSLNYNIGLDSLKKVRVYSPDDKPKFEISFTEVLEINSSDDAFFVTPGFVAVDNAGRIYVHDGPNTGKRTILVYGPEGSYITNLGRNGRGPGEFLSINQILFQSEMIHVYDGRMELVHTFHQDSLTYADTKYLHPENLKSYPELQQINAGIYPLAIRPDNKYLVKYSQYSFPNFWQPEDENVDAYHRYYLLSSDGSTLEKKLLVQGFSFIMPGLNTESDLFDNSPLFGVMDNGEFVAGWTREFLLKFYDQEGEYLNAFYFPVKKISLTHQSAEKWIRSQGYNNSITEDLISDLRDVVLPNDWPALHSIIVDSENRIWASRIIGESEVFEWWILNKNGELVARFEWPRKNEIMEIKGDYLYTLEADEAGVSSIVKYRIEMR